MTWRTPKYKAAARKTYPRKPILTMRDLILIEIEKRRLVAVALMKAEMANDSGFAALNARTSGENQ